MSKLTQIVVCIAAIAIIVVSAVWLSDRQSAIAEREAAVEARIEAEREQFLAEIEARTQAIEDQKAAEITAETNACRTALQHYENGVTVPFVELIKESGIELTADSLHQEVTKCRDLVEASSL